MMRIILIALLAFTLANCADKTYKVKQEAKIEDGRILNEVPQWFVDANIDKGLIKNRDADDFIYGVGYMDPMTFKSQPFFISLPLLWLDGKNRRHPIFEVLFLMFFF